MSTVSELFRVASAERRGVVQWKERVPETGPGVYIISLSNDPDAGPPALEQCPLQLSAVVELLRVRPELLLDGKRPSRPELAERLSRFWLPDEHVVYIGLAGTSIRNRVRQYYRTGIGASKPHAGGWPLKMLSVLDRLWVHFATCDDPDAAESSMLAHFGANVSVRSLEHLHSRELPLPYANLRAHSGRRKLHGITGACEPKASASKGKSLKSYN